MDEIQRRAWLWAIDEWRASAKVIGFMELEILGLRDANGDPLPDEVKQFFLALTQGDENPRNGRFLPKELIRRLYKSDVQCGVPAKVAKARLSGEFNISVSSIDQIVNLRTARLPRKARKT